jgi:hypothetical protein
LAAIQAGQFEKPTIAHLALAYHVLERLDRFLDWRDRIHLVNEVHVDVIGAEARETAVHGVEDVTT